MPLLNRDQINFALILLSVPLQYYVVHLWGSNEISRTYEISKMVTQFNDLKSRWLRVEPWREWCSDILLKMASATSNSEPDQPIADEDNGESPAVEVLKYRDKNGHFGQSMEPRDPRPPHVKFRVGQVVKHKLWGYHGVIIGWDLEARAPEQWLKSMHGENTEWRKQPNFSVLVDYFIEQVISISFKVKSCYPVS